MVNFKDSLKLFGVMLLTFGCVFITTVFLNFRIDLKATEPQITEATRLLYDANMTQCNIVLAAAGGMLGLTTLIVLLFSIGNFIGENGANMGVMKALGRGPLRIALPFAKFGLSVFAGAAAGFALAYSLGQIFYNEMFSAAGELNIKMNFHWQTLVFLLILPTVLFTFTAVLYAKFKLKKPALALIKGEKSVKVNKLSKRLKEKNNGKPFLKQLRRNMLFSNLILIFFVGFAAFGYGGMIQMAFSMSEVSDSAPMTAIFVGFGFLMGFVTLLLSLTFILNKNKKYIAMLKAYGYTEAETSKALFGGYRIVTYIGFAIGTVYQYVLIKLMVDMFAGAYGELPEVKFSFIGLAVALSTFILIYEAVMFLYKKRVERVSLKKVFE